MSVRARRRRQPKAVRIQLGGTLSNLHRYKWSVEEAAWLASHQDAIVTEPRPKPSAPGQLEIAPEHYVAVTLPTVTTTTCTSGM
jgi:hypothetical protein